MNEEIKEILDDLGNKNNYYINEFGLYYRRINLYDSLQLLDYITNLQQLYENALKVNQNENKYRTELEDKYVVLQQENKKLKEELKNRPIVDFTFDVYKDLEDYKSRCKKVNKLITDFMCTEEYCNVDPIAIAENYMKIQKALNGSDEK